MYFGNAEKAPREPFRRPRTCPVFYRTGREDKCPAQGRKRERDRRLVFRTALSVRDGTVAGVLFEIERRRFLKFGPGFWLNASQFGHFRIHWASSRTLVENHESLECRVQDRRILFFFCCLNFQTHQSDYRKTEHLSIGASGRNTVGAFGFFFV